jgi:hypothetical protein
LLVFVEAFLIQMLNRSSLFLCYKVRIYIFFLRGEGPRSRYYGRTTALRLFVQPCDEDEDKQFLYQFLQLMEHQWNEIDRGKPTTRRKTCPSATLSTTNLTWTDPGSNPGLHGESPATNRLSHGTAHVVMFGFFVILLANKGLF